MRLDNLGPLEWGKPLAELRLVLVSVAQKTR